MAMTRKEAKGKVEIARKLAKQGYPTYAKIFDEFDLNITEDPEVIAYMEPGKGRIVVNGNLNIDAISVVIRHEILHQYLEHEDRLIKHVAKKIGMDPNKLDDMSIEKVKNLIYRGKEFNIAGDFEISNLGYTDADKRAIRNLVMNGKVLSGLVTEDHNPDWVDLPLEDMFDKLLSNDQQDQQNQKGQGKGQDGNGQDSGSSSGQGSSGSGKGKMSKKDFDDLNKTIEDGNFDIEDDDPLRGNSGDEIDQDTFDKLSDKAKKNLMDKLSKMGPQIGDKGNADIQAKEQEEREKNDVTGGQQGGQDGKDQSKRGKGTGQGGTMNKNDQSGQDGNQSGGSSGSAAGNPESGIGDPLARGNGNLNRRGGTAQADGQNNIPERIRNVLNDKSLASKLRDEASSAVRKERDDKAKRELDKYKQSGIYKFKLSLSKFLRDELDDERDYTWKKFNKTYVNTGLFRQGRATEDGPIPLINIYFDQSGSWDASKIKVGEEAMGLIYKYKNEGKLLAKVYYFSNDVTDDRNDKRLNGGTEGQPIMDHIRQTHPNNVIIMTDSDISDIRTDTTVPGAVWLLFKGGRSQNLIDHIHGKAETVVLDI